MKERIESLVAEYGMIGLGTYLVISIATLCGVAAAITFGYQPESAASTAGVWGVAWLVTRPTKPLQIIGAIALTPLVARIIRGSRPAGEDDQGDG